MVSFVVKTAPYICLGTHSFHSSFWWLIQKFKFYVFIWWYVKKSSHFVKQVLQPNIFLQLIVYSWDIGGKRTKMGPFWGVVFHENTSSKSKSKGAELIWAMRLCWTQCKVHIYYHPVNNNHNVMEVQKNFGLQNLFHKMRIFLGTVKNLLREGFN